MSGARVYGIDELGGLHYIYVLEDEPESYGLPANPTVPAGVTAFEYLVKPGAAWGGIGPGGPGRGGRRQLRDQQTKRADGKEGGLRCLNTAVI